MPVCGKCEKGVIGSRTNPSVQCSGGCQSIFHFSCVKISKELIERLKDGSVYWKCEACKAMGRRSIVSEDVSDSTMGDIAIKPPIMHSSRSSATLDDVQSSIFELANRFKGLEDSQNFISNSLDTLKNDLKVALEEVKHLKLHMRKTEDECKSLRERVYHLEASQDSIQQEKIKDTLVITGIPLNKFDNNEVVLKVLTKVDERITSNDIINVSKVNIAANVKTTAEMYIVKMVSVELQTSILNKMRSVKRLSTEVVGLNFSTHSSSSIFIMQKLTQLQSKLYTEAKLIKKELKFRFFWVKNGVIMLRKDDSSKIFHIRSFNHLHNIRTSLQP